MVLSDMVLFDVVLTMVFSLSFQTVQAELTSQVRPTQSKATGRHCAAPCLIQVSDLGLTLNLV